MDPAHVSALKDWVARLDAPALRRFAADCAEQVLPVFERVRPDDLRPATAIAAARAYALGKVDDRTLSVARAEAENAAWDASAILEYGATAGLEAAASVAAAAKMACHPDPARAAFKAALLHIEAVQVIAVGAGAAEQAWRTGQEPPPSSAQRLLAAGESARRWQIQRLIAYQAGSVP